MVPVRDCPARRTAPVGARSVAAETSMAVPLTLKSTLPKFMELAEVVVSRVVVAESVTRMLSVVSSNLTELAPAVKV